MRHLDLFSGIGGFALAADWVWPGCEHIFCEIDDFCGDVLEKHWPDAPQYGDIRELTKERYTRDFGDPGDIDLLTGGFPCQPFSHAGKQLAHRDPRHLWPEMLRVIEDFQPRWVIGENVAGLTKLGLDQVLTDLEGEDYSVQALLIPACAVGAPHRRDRLWIIANSNRQRRNGRRPQLLTSSSQRSPSAFQPPGYRPIRGPWTPEPDIRRMAHGVPSRMDRLKALGNAIVPQVATEIMNTIDVIENMTDPHAADVELVEWCAYGRPEDWRHCSMCVVRRKCCPKCSDQHNYGDVPTPCEHCACHEAG